MLQETGRITRVAARITQVTALLGSFGHGFDHGLERSGIEEPCFVNDVGGQESQDL
jgi:hypothetical protein